MSNPILLTWRGRPNRQYFELSEAEQKKLWDKHEEAVKTSGVKTIVNCRCDWSYERYSHFGVELYQDMESLMKMKDLLFSVDWFSWIDSETTLSVPNAPVVPVAEGAGGIFKLFFVSPTQAYYNLAPKQREEKMVELDPLTERLGVKRIFTSSIFSSEKYLMVGLEQFSSLETLQEYSKLLWEMDWFRFVKSEVLRGLQT